MISYIIWDMDPKIFDGFEFLRWYGLCWAVGMILGYRIMLNIYKVEGIPNVELDKLTTYVMVGAIIGARFGHILFYDPLYYLNNPIEILPIRIKPTFQFTGLAGLASHGGIVGALIALYLYNRKFEKDYLWLLDRLVIGGALLGGFIRIGNLMNSEIIGTPTNLPWGFVFTHVDQIPRHPSQLYEAIFYLLIFALLFSLWKSRKTHQHLGLLFGLGLTLIFIQRFIVEFVKEDQVSFEDGLFLNMGQILSIPMMLIGMLFIVRSFKRSLTGAKNP